MKKETGKLARLKAWIKKYVKLRELHRWDRRIGISLLIGKPSAICHEQITRLSISFFYYDLILEKSCAFKPSMLNSPHVETP